MKEIYIKRIQIDLNQQLSGLWSTTAAVLKMIGSKTVRKQDQNPAIEEVIPHQSSTWWPLLPITRKIFTCAKRLRHTPSWIFLAKWQIFHHPLLLLHQRSVTRLSSSFFMSSVNKFTCVATNTSVRIIMKLAYRCPPFNQVLGPESSILGLEIGASFFPTVMHIVCQKKCQDCTPHHFRSHSHDIGLKLRHRLVFF